MNKQKIEEIGKEFVEKVLNFSFNNMAEKTNANRLLKAFVAGAEAVSAGVEAITQQIEVKDKEPAFEIEVVPVRKELVQAPVGLCRKIEQKIVVSQYSTDINNLIKEGWIVVSVIPQHVSASSSYSQIGGFCFLLEREV